jgi:hypothetical protein
MTQQEENVNGYDNSQHKFPDQMTARLIDAQGQVVREWLTDRPDLALTADRNCPMGWRVELVYGGKSTPCSV